MSYFTVVSRTSMAAPTSNPFFSFSTLQAACHP